MTRLLNEDLKVLQSFAARPEGRLMVQVLEKKLAGVDEQLRFATGEDLYRKQGKAQELAELIAQITGAGDVLNRQAQPPVAIVRR